MTPEKLKERIDTMLAYRRGSEALKNLQEGILDPENYNYWKMAANDPALAAERLSKYKGGSMRLIRERLNSLRGPDGKPTQQYWDLLDEIRRIGGRTQLQEAALPPKKRTAPPSEPRPLPGTADPPGDKKAKPTIEWPDEKRPKTEPVSVPKTEPVSVPKTEPYDQADQLPKTQTEHRTSTDIMTSPGREPRITGEAIDEELYRGLTRTGKQKLNKAWQVVERYIANDPRLSDINRVAVFRKMAIHSDNPAISPERLAIEAINYQGHRGVHISSGTN